MDFKQLTDKVSMHGEEGANHCPLWDYAVGKMGKIKNEIKKMLRQRIRENGMLLILWESDIEAWTSR